MVVVAQLVRASDCGSEGRGFESHHPPNKKVPKFSGLFCFIKNEKYYNKAKFRGILRNISKKKSRHKESGFKIAFYNNLSLNTSSDNI